MKSMSGKRLAASSDPVWPPSSDVVAVVMTRQMSTFGPLEPTCVELQL